MSSIKVTIKPTSGGDKCQAEIQTSATVRELKEEVARKCDATADQQRLIYKGQVLKDERTVDSYGMGNCRLSDRLTMHDKLRLLQAYRTSMFCIWSRPRLRARRAGECIQHI